MKFALVALVCVVLVLGGCSTVPVTADGAPDVETSTGGLDPIAAIVIVLMGLVLGSALSGN